MIARRLPGRAVVKSFSRLIFPAIISGMAAVLVTLADAPVVVPLACGVTWTMVGRTIIFLPDCAHPSHPAPNGPPAGNKPAPPQAPLPAN
jgi:hypothetical protein